MSSIAGDVARGGRSLQRDKPMANARAEGERQTLDLDRELPRPQPERLQEKRQENTPAALPAQAGSEEAQQLHTERGKGCRLLARNPSNVMPNAGSSTHFMPRLPMVGPLLP